MAAEEFNRLDRAYQEAKEELIRRADHIRILEAALRAVEWNVHLPTDTDGGYCPYCGNHRDDGHYRDFCVVYKALHAR